MIKSFDEWLGKPIQGLTFLQYSNYLQGWRNSMFWAYKGMSIAYDKWAETKWNEEQDKERLIDAWKMGLAIKSNAFMRKKDKKWVRQEHDTAWLNKSVEECADFCLNVQETFGL